jgi:hypothetical protein
LSIISSDAVAEEMKYWLEPVLMTGKRGKLNFNRGKEEMIIKLGEKDYD